MLKIKDLNLNNVIRQGDSQPREYQLDTGNLNLNLANRQATIRLMTGDYKGIAYETTTTVSSENKIPLSIDDVIPAREYRLEITVDDYVFPSRALDGQFNVDPSSHGQGANIIQIIGKDEIVRDVKEQVDSELEPFLGEIEQAELDRQAQEEAREATNKFAKDYLSEFPIVKSKSEEAITKANQADNLSKSVQSQFNQVVIDGDSSVEAAQARVDASGHTNATLKERLDKEHTEVAAQLTQTRNQMILTPDHFDGTDGQKIQQALDYALSEGEHFISLNRTYDLTGESVFMPTEDFWGRVVFRGGKIIKNDSGYMFDRTGFTKLSHAPQFDGTLFESNVDGVYVFNGEGLLRFEMNSCKFTRVGMVHTTRYIQTLRLHQCETEVLGCHFIHANNGYDVEISHHRGEQSSSEYQFLKMVSNTPNGLSYYGLRILSSVIEGYTRTHPIEVGAGYGLSIKDNYFEKNMGSIRIIKGVGTNRIQGMIEGNVFAANLDVYDVFVDTSLFAQRLTLKNNTATNDNSGKYLSNQVLGTKNDMETNNLPMLHNVSYYPENLNAIEENTSYAVTKHDLPDATRGVIFEIPLQQGTGFVNYDDLQYLVNIKGQYGSSAVYRGHLTGILTIDIHQEDGLKAVLHFDVLSTRNTHGSTSGNLAAEPVFDYYFKETGTKSTAYNSSNNTVCIVLPNFVNQSRTTCTFKGLDGLMHQQNVFS